MRYDNIRTVQASALLGSANARDPIFQSLLHLRSAGVIVEAPV